MHDIGTCDCQGYFEDGLQESTMESRDIAGVHSAFGESVFVLKDGGVAGASKLAVSLYREVCVLRMLGSKDCTAAADEVLDKERSVSAV